MTPATTEPSTSAGQPGPLAGLRVIELASFVSGPYAAMMLADLGADVVKVESPRGGDPLRRFGRSRSPVSALFANVNRGKRGVALDLKDTDDQKTLDELLRSADVMICNWRPPVIERLGLTDERLAELNSRLVRVYISGFGTDGPLAGGPTFDSIVQAHLGSADPDGSRPTIAGTYMVDKMTATMACQAVLAALVARNRSGLGDRVDLALLDAAAYLGFPDTMVNRTFLDKAPADPRNRQAAAVRAIRASDGWLLVAPVTSRQVRRACDVIGRPDLAETLLAIPDATALTAAVLDALEASTASATTAEWTPRFAAADVPAGPCLTIDQHLDDTQVKHNDLYRIDEWDGLGQVRHVRYPAVFKSSGKLVATSGPPQLGADTREVVQRMPARTEDAGG